MSENHGPITGLDDIGETLAEHTKNGAFIDEIAAGEDEMLVLVLNNENHRPLLIGASAWLEDIWENLPDEAV